MAEKLLVIGNPVVVVGDGSSRVHLSGELTDEQRQQLGDDKIASLQAAGHLQTQAQVDEADRLKRDQEDRRLQAQFGGGINPNYGTPSMTPEAAAKNEAPSLAEGDRTEPEGSGGDGDWQSTPVSQLDLDPQVAKALADAELATVGDVIAYGNLHDGLTELEGIGEAREQQIKEAIKKVAK